MTTTNAELIAEARAIVRAVGDGSSFDGRPAWLVIQDLADALESATTVTDEQVERAAKALFSIEEPDRNAFRWNREHPTEGLAWHGYWLDAARAALTAALTEGERR